MNRSATHHVITAIIAGLILLVEVLVFSWMIDKGFPQTVTTNILLGLILGSSVIGWVAFRIRSRPTEDW